MKPQTTSQTSGEENVECPVCSMPIIGGKYVTCQCPQAQRLAVALAFPPKPEPVEALPPADIATAVAKPASTILPLPEPTDEQRKVLESLLEWADNPRDLELTLGGFAGTGKTTLIRHFVDQMNLRHAGKVQDHEEWREHEADSDEPRKTYAYTSVHSFTGKACSVLRRKGLVEAATLHQLMYACYQNPVTKKIFFNLRSTIDPKFVVVDEASMVNKELYRDLKSFKRKVLYVGDMGQLPPVGDNPMLMLDPKLRLETVHRQARDNPIIQFATEVRQGSFIPRDNQQDGLGVAFGLKQSAKDSDPVRLLGYDQVIVAFNKTRTKLNAEMRQAKGFKMPLEHGEKLICLKNDYTHGLFNGLIVWLDQAKPDTRGLKDSTMCWLLSFHDDLGNQWIDVPSWNAPFNPKYEGKISQETLPKEMAWFDYGYAITCHKSQGSEWESVAVVEEFAPPKLWEMKVWRYTAATRASKKLLYLR